MNGVFPVTLNFYHLLSACTSYFTTCTLYFYHIIMFMMSKVGYDLSVINLNDSDFFSKSFL